MFEESSSISSLDPLQIVSNTTLAHSHLQLPTGNGVDSVPYITFEGKRRDLTLVGAKEVEEYLKTLETIARESK